MKKRHSLVILALLLVTLVAMGCTRRIITPEDPPLQGPYPAAVKEWNRTFGGRYSEAAQSVYQTACGSFIIAGTTESFGAGEADFWLVKTDHEGNKEWSQTFGGPKRDLAHSVQQTHCGGFIIAGTTWSFGEGEGDFWLVKTDAYGNKQWSRTFGGPYEDWAASVQQTACGGFIIAGHTGSFGAGHFDSWLVKTDVYGNKEWSQTFGGPKRDLGHSVQQTHCGGFILAGRMWAVGRGEGSFWEGDFWLVKTDAYGNKQWSRTFGGHYADWATSVQQTACGGFIIAGHTRSFGAGNFDFWVIKTDPEGSKEWSQTFGGRGWDRAFSVQQTADGGLIIAGYTTTAWIYQAAFPVGVTPKTPYGCIWMVKTDPYGNLQWSQTFGTLGEADAARSVKQTACGGFIIAGWTESFGAGERDFWLIKLAPSK